MTDQRPRISESPLLTHPSAEAGKDAAHDKINEEKHESKGEAHKNNI